MMSLWLMGGSGHPEGMHEYVTWSTFCLPLECAAVCHNKYKLFLVQVALLFTAILTGMLACYLPSSVNSKSSINVGSYFLRVPYFLRHNMSFLPPRNDATECWLIISEMYEPRCRACAIVSCLHGAQPPPPPPLCTCTCHVMLSFVPDYLKVIGQSWICRHDRFCTSSKLKWWVWVVVQVRGNVACTSVWCRMPLFCFLTHIFVC